jgi:hypothetical protein
LLFEILKSRDENIAAFFSSGSSIADGVGFSGREKDGLLPSCHFAFGKGASRLAEPSPDQKIQLPT